MSANRQSTHSSRALHTFAILWEPFLSPPPWRNLQSFTNGSAHIATYNKNYSRRIAQDRTGVSRESGGRRLGLCGARHTGIGLRGCVYLTLCSDRVGSFGGVMRQRNFVAISVYLIRFNVEPDEVCGAETCRDG